ncbi:sugar transferase [Sinomonas susongensis]|uniref:sugar transferase n=1 Tax=Sinomonas susongensis TaxID=1324851 RepID=UPI001FEC4C11|nr:sugar transferase [Sinomonas susongensis]
MTATAVTGTAEADQTSTATRARSRRAAHLALADLASVGVAMAGAQLLRFGPEGSSADLGQGSIPYGLVSLVLGLSWWAALGLSGSRDVRVLGYGPEEYKRVTSASLWLFGGIAVLSYVLQLETARGYVAVALPLGLACLLFGRRLLRSALIRDRQSGNALRRVLLVGASKSVRHLHVQLGRHPEAGYRPVAAYVTDPDTAGEGEGTGGAQHGLSMPVARRSPDLDGVLAAVEASGADTVVVSGGASLDPSALRQLGWALATRDVGLVMAPALTDVAGPRIHTQPVAGLPLIHVTTPRLDGPKGLAKRGFDIIAAVVLLALLAVPMLLIAIWVKLDSPGPVIFRQTRIGRAGEPFRMLKFRSMVVGAERQLTGLHDKNEGSGPLFKLRADPRVTRFGRFIRRHSLDELPQLFNVLGGSMSLIGPRPPLPQEVERYDKFAHRRLLIKPGITGLWQVSGRSDLSWDDAIKLDLYYVENWSMIQDVIILFRTVGAVAAKNGAY